MTPIGKFSAPVGRSRGESALPQKSLTPFSELGALIFAQRCTSATWTGGVAAAAGAGGRGRPLSPLIESVLWPSE